MPPSPLPVRGIYTLHTSQEMGQGSPSDTSSPPSARLGDTGHMHQQTLLIWYRHRVITMSEKCGPDFTCHNIKGTLAEPFRQCVASHIHPAWEWEQVFSQPLAVCCYMSLQGKRTWWIVAHSSVAFPFRPRKLERVSILENKRSWWDEKWAYQCAVWSFS